MSRRRTIGTMLTVLSVTALSMGAFAVNGTFAGYAHADSRVTGGNHSTYSFTGTWPAVDIQPLAKCVAVTFIKTEKTGSDLTECAGGVDVKYWSTFTGPVLPIHYSYIPDETRVSFMARKTTKRNKSNCPDSYPSVDYVKCLKVPGPSGTGSDGVVFTVGTLSGPSRDSDMTVDWDNGY